MLGPQTRDTLSKDMLNNCKLNENKAHKYTKMAIMSDQIYTITS